MTREPGGDPLFSNQLAAFYVRQNTPQMLEYGHKVENDMAYILHELDKRISDIEQGVRQPTIPGQCDLIEMVSPYSECIYRVTLYLINGKWVIDNAGLTGVYIFFFQQLAKRKQKGTTYEDLIQNAFESTSQYARFFSRLVELHPMIGMTNMFFFEYAKKHNRECLAWYEPALKHAQAVLITLQNIEEGVHEKGSRPLINAFITDMRKELELLLVDCMNLIFLQAHGQDTVPNRTVMSFNDIPSNIEKGYKHEGFLTSHFLFEIEDDHKRQQYLQKMKSFYAKHSKYFEWVHVEGVGDAAMATEKLADKTGSIAVPFYIKGSDITKFLRFLETYTKAIKHALDGKSQIMSRDGDYEIKFRNGIHALFRGLEDTKVDPEIGRAQARISFKYEGVKIRLDRDTKRGKVILDFGEADFDDLLTMVDMLVTAYEHNSDNQPSLMDTRLQYSDPAKKNEVKEIQARAKVALVASAVMSLTKVSFPHRKEYFSSYHSSDHIAKQLYFDQFPQIAEEFERMFRGK